MIIYLLKSATCLALLLAFYHLVLEREKMHNFNRFYLLGSILFAFLAPLYIIYIDVAPLILKATSTPSLDYSTEITPEIIVEKSIDYTGIFIAIYSLISSIFFLRFGKNLFHIIEKIRKNQKVNYQKAVLVLVDDNILPHTFWNYIFINKNDFENQKIEQELFTHELTHVTQKHTLDVLLLEFLQAIFWINPFFILLKKAVQLNHEFLADETVINQHKNTIQYQHLLLNKAAWKNDYYLASNLNYSLTKKRLKMMTTQSSQTKIWLKKLAVFPLLASFIFLFAERIEAQEIVEDSVETIVEDVPFRKDDLSNSEIYKKYFYKNLTIQRKDENGKTISKKYSELNDEEKARLIPPPPLKSKKIIPTKAQFEALKDSKKYAVWIDGKVVKNETLSNFKPTDFASYFNSHVYKNARSERFPQENQASLQTTAYFNAQNKKRVEKFMNYIKKNNNIIEIKEEKGNIKIIEVQENPKFNKDWYITINGQKYYYTFDKNERIARYYKNGKLVNLDIVKEYKKKQKIFENLKSKGKHYVFKTESDKKIIDREYSDLGGMYFRMSRAEKNKVSKPQNPIKPYVTLRKNNKVFYKLRKDLTEEDKLLIPPPPPVPNATKEEIEKAKNAYEAWKKRTGNDFAPPPPQPVKKKQEDIEKRKKQLPSSFIRKANEKENFVFNSIELVKSEKESKLNDVDKKQLLLRKTIIQATTLREKRFNFKIDGKESKINDVYKYIFDNPLCELSTNKNEKNILTLSLDNFKEKKMSNNELQNVYSEVFKYIQ